MYYFKNFFLFTLIALLVVQCQKDDASVSVESEQLKKELSRDQLEEKALELANSQEFQDLIKYGEGSGYEDHPDKLDYYGRKFREKYSDRDMTLLLLKTSSEIMESGRLEITALDDSSGKLYKYSLLSKKKVNEIGEKTKTWNKEREERRWGSYCPDRCDRKKSNCKSFCGEMKSACDYGISFDYGMEIGYCVILGNPWAVAQCQKEAKRKRDMGYAQCKNDYNSCVSSCERDYGNCMFDCEYSK